MVLPPLGGLLLATALLAVVLALVAEELRAGKPSANEGWAGNTTSTARAHSRTHLRLRVMDAFCSMSTERSIKSSSLVLTCRERRFTAPRGMLSHVTVTRLTVSQHRHFVSLVSVPLNTSSTHVRLG